MAKVDVQSLRSRVERINSLPTIPGVLKKLLVVIENPRVSLSEISGFISNDPALATKILKMVNSPVYGFPGRISSVNQSVILLGLNVVKGLLLGVSVFELMQKSMVGLWEHSMGCAIMARIIAQKKQLKEPEEVSVAGLLHDLGKVILILQFPDEYEKAMNDAETKGTIIGRTERDYFAADHANAGVWMAEKWSFPRNLTDVIGYHHEPHLAKQAPYEAAIVHVSDVLLRGMGFGFAGDNSVPPVHPAAWEKLLLTKKDIKEVLAEAEDALEASREISL